MYQTESCSMPIIRIFHLPTDVDMKRSRTDKCLILDIDETLVCTMKEHNTEGNIFKNHEFLPIRHRLYSLHLDDVSSAKGTGHQTRMWGIKRPHLDEFLSFAFDYFTVVGVWSAGKAGYVDAVVNHAFENSAYPHVVYSRNECKGDIYEKPLNDMYSHTRLAGLLNERNTFIIDDRFSAFSGCNPHNGILIPEYNPSPNSSSLNQDDTCLQRLQEWFLRSEVMHSKDIRYLDKNNIF